jgi:hypothetical protein
MIREARRRTVRDMSTATEPRRLGKLRRLVVGDRQTIAGTVYGTIIVLAVLTAGAKPYEHQLWRLDVIVAVSATVLWLAHVYSHGLGESLRMGRRLGVAEVTAIARREYSIVLAAVLPVLAITLGAIDLVGARAAVWLGLGVGVAMLVAQGVRYAQLERMSPIATIGTVTLNAVFVMALVAAEVLIAHQCQLKGATHVSLACLFRLTDPPGGSALCAGAFPD